MISIAADNLTWGKLGKYHLDRGFQIDGSTVRFWATRKLAVDAAKAIGWPVKSVEMVHTRFQIGYAIADTRFGALSRESYGLLHANRNIPAAAPSPAPGGVVRGGEGGR